MREYDVDQSLFCFCFQITSCVAVVHLLYVSARAVQFLPLLFGELILSLKRQYVTRWHDHES